MPLQQFLADVGRFSGHSACGQFWRVAVDSTLQALLLQLRLDLRRAVGAGRQAHQPHQAAHPMTADADFRRISMPTGSWAPLKIPFVFL